MPGWTGALIVIVALPVTVVFAWLVAVNVTLAG